MVGNQTRNLSFELRSMSSFDDKIRAETLPYFPDIDVGTLEVKC